MVYFTINFHNYQTFAKFTRSLLDKFFVLTIGKSLGENCLIVEVFLPPEEFRKFIEVLSTMTRKKLVKGYNYAIQDLRIRRRQTISPPFFKENKWVYNHKNYMETMKQKVLTLIQRV